MKKPVSHRKFHSGGHFPRWRHISIILRMNSVFIEHWHSKACPKVIKTDSTNNTKQYWPNLGIHWSRKIVSGEAKPNFETYLNDESIFSRVMSIRLWIKLIMILFFVLTVFTFDMSLCVVSCFCFYQSYMICITVYIRLVFHDIAYTCSFRMFYLRITCRLQTAIKMWTHLVAHSVVKNVSGEAQPNF